MKVLNLSLRISLLSILFIFISCEEKEVEYIDYEVNFFKDSPFITYTPPVWETISEEYLAREAHNEGATFTDVTIEVLTREAWTSMTIGEDNTIELITDLESNTTQTVSCNDFFQIVEFVDVNHPAQYGTITTQEILVNGTGAEIPARYMTRSYSVLHNDAKYDPIPNTNPISHTVSFRIPAEMSVVDYIQDTYMSEIQGNCIESVGFSIN